MKTVKVILKIMAALAVVAGALFLLAAYWDKLCALFARCGAWKEKLPTKDKLIRLNPFRKAEIRAEFADYADVD